MTTCSPIAVLLVLVPVFSSVCCAQEGDPMPTERIRYLPPGGFVDLDTGIVLPSRDRKPLQGDLLFDRDGLGFFVQAMRGACVARIGETSPGDEWSEERQRLGRDEAAPGMWFVRTDRGVARVTLAVADTYATGSAMLRWVVVPPGSPVFLAAPTALEANWQGKHLALSWQGDEPRYLVEVETGTDVKKITCEGTTTSVADLAPDGVHRIRVRGLGAGGAISLPAEVVQFGRRQVPIRGTVEYPVRWYDATGGLCVTRGEVATEDAEVVFYLYGVYVPGGGVQKLGRGASTWQQCRELPEAGYLPTYGRLDDHDVLAVRLADGRYAKLWLEPSKGNDVRDGMSVHFAFLADGRRHLLPPPGDVASLRENGAATLKWRPVAAAARYRVTVAGREKPYETTESQLRIDGLTPERVHDIELRTVGTDGEVSDPAMLTVHTFGEGVVVGRCTVHAQNGGVVFATGAQEPDGQRCDLALVGGAGGASLLRFAARGGIAPVGDRAFGVFPAEGDVTLGTDFSSDDSRPDDDRFLVRTADGGRAFVRIVVRGWPKAELEYVFVPKR